MMSTWLIGLRRLAEKARTRIHGVYTINLSSKTTTGNAALMGLGNTRRIVLGDTLLERYSTEEIEVIVAHELGHHVHRDMARLMVFQAAIILTGFYLANLVLKVSVPYFGFNGISDIAAFPPACSGIGRLQPHYAAANKCLHSPY